MRKSNSLILSSVLVAAAAVQTTPAMAHPTDSNLLPSIGVNSKITVLTPLNFPGGEASILDAQFGRLHSPRERTEIAPYYCSISLMGNPTPYDRVVPAGTVLTVKSITEDDNTGVPEHSKVYGYTIEFYSSQVMIGCSGTSTNDYPTIGDFRNAFIGVFHLNYAQPDVIK